MKRVPRLTQLHTRVLWETKEKIKRIAIEKRCEMGAVIDEAIRRMASDPSDGEAAGDRKD